MTLTLTRRMVILSTLIAAPGFALGLVVFDPTSYAEAVSQVRQAVLMVTIAKSHLNMVQANLRSFGMKQMWQTAKFQLMNAHVRNVYGETNGWNAALNTNSPTAAATAWGMANIKVTPGTSMQGQIPGSSPQLASLAMVDASDSISPDCLNAVGQYRDLRTQNAGAQANLQTQQLDTTAATNSEVQQLNLLNAAEAQRMNELQAQGALHACLAAQMTVANMAQRNAAAQTINTTAYIQQQHAVHNMNPDNQSQTWQTYIP